MTLLLIPMSPESQMLLLTRNQLAAVLTEEGRLQPLATLATARNRSQRSQPLATVNYIN